MRDNAPNTDRARERLRAARGRVLAFMALCAAGEGERGRGAPSVAGAQAAASSRGSGDSSSGGALRGAAMSTGSGRPLLPFFEVLVKPLDGR